jgi:hypothetical protein
MGAGDSRVLQAEYTEANEERGMRTIVIVARNENTFDVHEGTAFIDRLCWDELLGTVAVLTHPRMNDAEPRIPPYRLRSIDEVRETESELRRRIRELEDKLPRAVEEPFI